MEVDYEKQTATEGLRLVQVAQVERTEKGENEMRGLFGERYANKRLMKRRAGRFAKVTMDDLGIGGVCECGHLKINVYDGDPRDEFPNPRNFRCFTCEPKTDAETQRDAETEAPKQKGIYEWLNEAADNNE
jgi:hypothetical protein